MSWKDNFPKENRYFETENGILYCGDCLKVMEEFPQNEIDLIITSPPYNVGIDYGVYKDSLTPKEYFSMLEELAILMKKVLKFDGRFAINLLLNANMKHIGKTYRTSPVSEFYNILKKVGLGFHTVVVLSEDTPHRTKYTAWGSWLSSSNPYIYCPLETVIIGYNKSWKKSKKGISDITKDEFIELVNGIWKYRAETRKYTNANFSEDIPFNAMKILSYVRDLVLDPFIGSGTTAVVCEKLNRRWIGIEINPEYCEITKQRILNLKLKGDKNERKIR